MRYILLGCKVFMRELYSLCAVSPNIVEIKWMKEALHTVPSDLRAALQTEIDTIEADPETNCDAILLAFGLCSMGTVGLKSKRFPLVIPRAHDCITVLLGSRKTYQKWFNEYSGGIYWYSSGWIEQFKTAGRQAYDNDVYLKYLEKYGEENAQYLMEVERGWMQHYTAAVFIKWDNIYKDEYAQITLDYAKQSNLDYVEAKGEPTILKKLVDGLWDDDILVAQPNTTLYSTNDEHVLGAK